MTQTQEVSQLVVQTGTCDHRWVSVEDLADELQIPKSTIYGWKNRGQGPAWIRVGKHLRARRVDVEAWLDGLADTA
ncbi:MULTISPECIES: helix-turn-helix transcriptional regulator [Streptomyces]|uniref:helix-turn-helix transcriptional regulator n=1 Tax=Streptomyces TaxID=1883 RepID=UPI00344838FD